MILMCGPAFWDELEGSRKHDTGLPVARCLRGRLFRRSGGGFPGLGVSELANELVEVSSGSERQPSRRLRVQSGRQRVAGARRMGWRRAFPGVALLVTFSAGRSGLRRSLRSLCPRLGARGAFDCNRGEQSLADGDQSVTERPA